MNQKQFLRVRYTVLLKGWVSSWDDFPFVNITFQTMEIVIWKVLETYITINFDSIPDLKS